MLIKTNPKTSITENNNCFRFGTKIWPQKLRNGQRTVSTSFDMAVTGRTCITLRPNFRTTF